MEYIEYTKEMSFVDSTLNKNIEEQPLETKYFKKFKAPFEIGDLSFRCQKHESTKRNS